MKNQMIKCTRTLRCGPGTCGAGPTAPVHFSYIGAVRQVQCTRRPPRYPLRRREQTDEVDTRAGESDGTQRRSHPNSPPVRSLEAERPEGWPTQEHGAEHQERPEERSQERPEHQARDPGTTPGHRGADEPGQCPVNPQTIRTTRPMNRYMYRYIGVYMGAYEMQHPAYCTCFSGMCSMASQHLCDMETQAGESRLTAHAVGTRLSRAPGRGRRHYASGCISLCFDGPVPPISLYD